MRLIAWLMIARFRAANHQLATEEFFVVQFFHCSLRFFHRLHLHEGETFRALVMPITHDFGILNVTDTVE